VAAALEIPTLHAFGFGGINRYSHYDGSGDGTSSLTASGSFAANTPMRIALGTGIERSWVTAEVNVAAYLPMGDAYAAHLEGRSLQLRGGTGSDVGTSFDSSARARGAVNFGVGAEFVVNPQITLLAGLSTDISAAPKGSLVADRLNYFPSRTDRVATSFGIGSHGEGGDLYLGGELGYAWGDRLAVNGYQLPARLDTTSTQTYSLLLVIAGTTSYRAIKRAVNDLTEVIDPSTKKPMPTKPERDPVMEPPPKH
jgi:hypothetical protein